MTAERHPALSPWLQALCFGAGLMDTTTGLLLVFAPNLTLRLMLVPEVSGELFFLRWVGAFVASVGLVYLLPFLQARSAPDLFWSRLLAALEMTALVRFCIALFVGSCLLSGALSWHWVSVAVVDMTLALLQLWIVPGLRSHARA